MSPIRKAYPSEVSDDEWALGAPYLTLAREDAGRRAHPLREVFNGLRYGVRTGGPWRWMPNDLPPWAAVSQRAQRPHAAGCFEQPAEDLRAVLRLAAGRKATPSAAILDSHTLGSASKRHPSFGGRFSRDAGVASARRALADGEASAVRAVAVRRLSPPVRGAPAEAALARSAAVRGHGRSRHC